MRKGLGYHNRRSPFGFNPGTLFATGAQGVWYDPSDASTLFSDTAGTTPSPTPGAGALSVVGKMLDKSGNGNHAISYNTTTARPELSARVNLLTYSEQFDNGVWTNNTRVTANTSVAPDGTTTADTFTSNGTVNSLGISVSSVSGAQYTVSIYAKYTNNQWLLLQLSDAGTTDRARAWFDIQNGVLGTTATTGGGVVVSRSIAPVGNGWYRCVLTATNPITTLYAYTIVATADGSTATAANGQSMLIWGADLRPANIGTSVPAYQRIADQYTYDSSGFPRYLVFNGTASGMYTPANLGLSGTDKATVFAGVRKLSDAAAGVVTELSATAFTNNGAFAMSAPGGALNSFFFRSRGTSVSDSEATFAAPTSRVVTGIGDIGADTNILRVNGTQAATSSADQGTGNYGSYALNIGVRSAAATPSLYFNGYLYSAIVVGSSLSAAQISSTESWINVKEGTVY